MKLVHVFLTIITGGGWLLVLGTLAVIKYLKK